MSESPPELNLENLATAVVGRFRGYVDVEDLVSVGQLWMLEHPQTVATYRSKHSTDHYLAMKVRGAMEIEARKARAEYLGYSVEDEYAYGLAMISLALPKVAAGDRTPPTMSDDGGTSSGTLASEGGNWLAIYADVSAAWESRELLEEDRTWLRLRFIEGRTIEEISALTGTPRETTRRRVKAASQRMIDMLGGSRPRSCDPGCVDCRLRQRPGTRHADPGSLQATEV